MASLFDFREISDFTCNGTLKRIVLNNWKYTLG